MSHPEPERRRLLHIFPDGIPRNPELLGHSSLRAAFHQHLVPNDMYLVHLEHPPSGPEAQRFGNRQSRPQVDHFPSGEWITF